MYDAKTRDSEKSINPRAARHQIVQSRRVLSPLADPRVELKRGQRKEAIVAVMKDCSSGLSTLTSANTMRVVFTVSSLHEEIALRPSFGAESSLWRETRYYKAAWYSWGAQGGSEPSSQNWPGARSLRYVHAEKSIFQTAYSQREKISKQRWIRRSAIEYLRCDEAICRFISWDRREGICAIAEILLEASRILS